MTHLSAARRNGTCTVSGCHEPRHVSKSGKKYTKCDLHYRADYRRQYQHVPVEHRPQNHPSAVGKRVEVLVIDIRKERVYRVEGVICEDEAMPLTQGELLKIMAEASERGVFVAQYKPYRESDLYNEEVEEIRT